MSERKIYKENFPSISNLINTIENRKNNPVMQDCHTSHDKGRLDWFNTRSYDEACSFAKFGWPDPLEDLKKNLRASIKQSAKFQVINKSMPYNSIIGYVPHVPNAIQNLPNSMITTDQFPQKRKTIHVVFCNGGNCNEDPEFYLKSGSALINALNIMERSGIQVRIDLCFFPACSGDEYLCPTVTLKDYGQRFDLLKLCFPLANSSMERRLGFRWLETHPQIKNISWNFGYGRTIDSDLSMEILKDDSTYVITNYWIRNNEYDIKKILEFLDFRVKE